MAGVKGRSGRKTLAHEVGIKRLLQECWTTAQRHEVIRTLHAKASDKEDKACVPAATLLFAYAYGRPTERVEINDPTLDTIKSVAAQHIQTLRRDFAQSLKEGTVTEDYLMEVASADLGIPKEQILDGEAHVS